MLQTLSIHGGWIVPRARHTMSRVCAIMPSCHTDARCATAYLGRHGPGSEKPERHASTPHQQGDQNLRLHCPGVLNLLWAGDHPALQPLLPCPMAPLPLIAIYCQRPCITTPVPTSSPASPPTFKEEEKAWPAKRIQFARVFHAQGFRDRKPRGTALQGCWN